MRVVRDDLKVAYMIVILVSMSIPTSLDEKSSL